MQEKDWILLEEADFRFRKLVRRFVKERDKVSVEGISLPGVLILNTIMSEGDQRLGDLAEQLDLTSGAVTALCDKLEASGFAVRKRSDTDRRSVVLGITDEGREMIRRNKDTGSIIIDEIFGGFTPAELETLILYLKRLNERIEGFSEKVREYSKRADEEAGSHSDSLHSQRTNKFISY
ncbi:MarR family transcriptional regulator [Neobacillus mesonae]|nr:MarR family transcriptional regulator [Neobacillus mesonae]